MRKRRLWLVVRVNKKGKRKTTMPAKKTGIVVFVFYLFKA